MRFFPTIEFVEKIPKDVYKEIRYIHRYKNIGGTYCFSTKHIMIRKNTGQTVKLLMHELGHWLIAIITKSYKIHLLYDNLHLEKEV